MAKLDIIAPYILAWEGGFVNDPDDHGGATNKGVTLAVWRKQGYDKNGDGVIDVADLKQVQALADRALKLYGRIDVLLNNAGVMPLSLLEELKVDEWNQMIDINIRGVLNGQWGITIPQKMLGVTPDGVVGDKTIAALNEQDPIAFFNALKTRRREFLQDICRKRPANYKFLRGWLNRLDGIRYGSLTYGRKEVRF